MDLNAASRILSELFHARLPPIQVKESGDYNALTVWLGAVEKRVRDGDAAAAAEELRHGLGQEALWSLVVAYYLEADVAALSKALDA